ncbi:MAG: hypothetical protein JWP27_2265 [Flaviaesturariibacter sp.]|nr:hypothetical protein [Flaviaesturariibacter sp.]
MWPLFLWLSRNGCGNNGPSCTKPAGSLPKEDEAVLAEKALDELVAKENGNGGKKKTNDDLKAERPVFRGEMVFEEGVEI